MDRTPDDLALVVLASGFFCWLLAHRLFGDRRLALFALRVLPDFQIRALRIGSRGGGAARGEATIDLSAARDREPPLLLQMFAPAA